MLIKLFIKIYFFSLKEPKVNKNVRFLGVNITIHCLDIALFKNKKEPLHIRDFKKCIYLNVIFYIKILKPLTFTKYL